ncbi:GntR family transcriptional regulator [Spiractinospora alimapuensis]|uniref:GntR family transcriptional regulator n=1 Tax=Spiractinospora alimapuensis TaxID=2820884 RepID=UPI001F2B60EB|nr:GntR family transcriptional regulator [Spiractinospora alimapuensis]QVQ51433.1 GntR family transcriptional regulator [Spiractinospora alimapuensis]
MNSGRRSVPHSRSKRHRLADHVRERIHDGRYPAGDRLPTEEDLAAQHDVSRNTVRDAMKDLENEGLVIIRQGSGTYVRDSRPIVHLATSVSGGIDSERFRQGFQPAMKLAGYDRIQEKVAIAILTAQGEVASRLNIDENLPLAERQIVERRCDRLVDGELWQQQLAYYPASIALNTELMIPEQIERGTHAVLRELGYAQTWSYDLVGARMPEPRERASFGIPSGVPLLVQTRVAYAGDTAVRITETLMPADRHRLMYAEGDVDEGVLVLGTDVNLIER